ncbi:hypothetical protein [Brevibacterium casei]|nr:hypothetical protein [Brevibacterium casei]
MSKEEFQLRIGFAEEHVISLHQTELERVHIGNARSGFVVWYPTQTGSSWPAAVEGRDEGAAWVHIPAAAKRPADGVDPIRLARQITRGTLDRIELGAPAATFYWSLAEGLSVSNDRLGMVRLYQFDFPGFGIVWSTRGGLAHIFAGQEPNVEQSTWSEIATFGWNMSGRAHLGNGQQLPASTTVHTDNCGRISVTSDIDEWIASTAVGQVPPDEVAAAGMVDAVAVAGWWKNRPMADLSGGKDSRVTAAAAIKAGVVDAVKTVNTDTGEVETARRLLSLIPHPIDHRIIEPKPPVAPVGGVLARYLSSQRAWEGAYNAISAHRGAQFRGFLPVTSPSINGLGGEAIQGRTTATAASRERLISQDAAAGQEWLKRLVRTNMGPLEEAQAEPARMAIDVFAERARSLGFTTAFQIIDFFYHFSKMPFWSQPQANSGTLLPFYSPQLLPRTMRSLTNPSQEYGSTHRKLLAQILPGWANVPFYKGSAKTRSIPWMWNNADWGDLRDTVCDGVPTLSSFSVSKVQSLIREAGSGDGRAKHEISFARVMWELSFREFAQEVKVAARRTAAAVDQIRTGTNNHRIIGSSSDSPHYERESLVRCARESNRF